MKFSHRTLSSTTRRFNVALSVRGLKLPWEATQNVWAQIAVGKNYSAAVSDAKANGPLLAVPISAKSICATLQIRNRQVDANAAEAIFIETIGPDIGELCLGVAELIEIVKLRPDVCVKWVGGDRSRIGLLDATRGGYFPVSEMAGIDLSEDETIWLQNSTDLMVTVINALGGKSARAALEICASNSMAARKKSDKMFRSYFAANIELTCTMIAHRIIEVFAGDEPSDWDLDFDSIWNSVYFVFEQACYRKDSWLKADCDLAEAVIDHVAVRVRETMKWMSEADEGEIDNPVHTIAWTAQLAMTKILNAPEY